MSQDDSSTIALAARWVLPIAASPIRDGLLRVREGRITDVRPSRVGETVDVDLGDAVLLPAFANPHTHLDLSELEQCRPATASLVDWLEQIVAYRRGRSPQSPEGAIRSGLVQSIRSGVLALGDISAGGESWAILCRAPIRAVVYREVLGLSQERAEPAWTEFQRWLKNCVATPLCRPGVSPHAPYSTHRLLFERAARCNPSVPVAIHIAESAEEQQLLERRAGPFTAFLQQLGAWEPAGLIGSHQRLLELFQDRSDVVWIHGNYLGSLKHLLCNRWVVWCPRTHAAFGHRRYPLAEYLAAGVHVAIGTDSLASNPGLDLLGELRFVHREYREVSPEWLIRQGTLGNAAALGCDRETGSLEAGKSADLIVVRGERPVGDDPYRALLDVTAEVTDVMFQGRWLVRQGRATAELQELNRP